MSDVGDITINLDRGDGLAVSINTPAEGWTHVRLRPLVDENTLEVVLVGKGIPRNDALEDMPLPVQTLSTLSVVEADPPEVEIVEPRIRVTGEATAVNEIDGADWYGFPKAPSSAAAKARQPAAMKDRSDEES